MGKYYALLITVGKYGGAKNLPSYEMDARLMREALTNGLKLSSDNIRVLGEDGDVRRTGFARTLTEFSSMLQEDDGFILYFSGHGYGGTLCFTDGVISIQSIVNFMENLQIKNKIVILDCCYSGDFFVSDTKEMKLDEAISTFAGAGTVVLASSASDENSWLGPGKNHSLYTGMLATAMTLKRRIRKGRVFLTDINEEVIQIARAWNAQNPNRIQHPIYRANTGGTICFEVKKYNPYETLQICQETDKYTIKSVEPLSSLEEKRLAVFVLVKEKCDAKKLASMTRKIASDVKEANVFSTKTSEERFKDTAARAVWCYFGYDESDIVNHRYFARSIWCVDGAGRRKYFKKQKEASVIRNIWVSLDPLYETVRKLQQSDISNEEFQHRAKKLLSKTVSMAEKYIADIREIDNQTQTIADIRRNYGKWIQEVYEEYYRMTELPVAPNELHDWFGAIENLAGCILDMAILLNKDKEYADNERWLIQNCIRRYNEGLEKLKELDENLKTK